MNLSLAAMLLAAWGVVQPVARRRPRLLVAALLLGLAAAAIVAALGNSRPASFVGTGWDTGGIVFLQIVAGVVLLAAGLALVAVPHAVTLVLAALVGWCIWPALELGGVLRPAGAAAALLAVGALGWVVVIRLRPGRVFLALDRWLLDRRGAAIWRPAPGWEPTAWPMVAAAAGVTTLAVPHLATVFGGALAAVVAGYLAARRGSLPAWGILLALPPLFLMLIWTMHLSGPLGGWIPGLIDGPFSPRAARWLALLAAVAAVPIAGLWPLHGVTRPVLLAPLTIAIGGVFAVSLVPDGVRWWQPALAPLALAGMAHAVARRLPGPLLVAAGIFGLWTGTPDGALGGAILLASAWAMVVLPTTWIGRVPVAPVVVRLLWLVPAVGALVLLRGAMTTEVVYTFVAIAVTAVGIAELAAPNEAPVDPVREPRHIPAVNPVLPDRI